MIERLCLFCRYNPTLMKVLCILCAAVAYVNIDPPLLGVIIVTVLYGVLCIGAEIYLFKRKVKILYKVKKHLIRD